VRTAGNGGVYDFRFNQIKSGSYRVFAGTDFNNNGFICDVGEACGAFLTLSRPSTIEVTRQSRDSIEFNTGFNVNFLNQQMLQDESSIPYQGIARLQPIREVAP
jgi:serine protease